jgi:protein-S-isoprenylcysteine O-methyltransferase Ste14
VLLCVLAGAGLQWLYPIRLFPSPWHWVLAILLIMDGIFLILYCAWIFKKAETDIKPWKRTSRLITTGIYRFSRNPIYVAFLLVALGIACAVNSLWVLLMTIPLIVILDRYVIFKEEKYLEQKFGEEYEAYRRQVRRWV